MNIHIDMAGLRPGLRRGPDLRPSSSSASTPSACGCSCARAVRRSSPPPIHRRDHDRHREGARARREGGAQGRQEEPAHRRPEAGRPGRRVRVVRRGRARGARRTAAHPLQPLTTDAGAQPGILPGRSQDSSSVTTHATLLAILELDVGFDAVIELEAASRRAASSPLHSLEWMPLPVPHRRGPPDIGSISVPLTPIRFGRTVWTWTCAFWGR